MLKKKNLKENIQVKQFSCDFPEKIRNSQIIIWIICNNK